MLIPVGSQTSAVARDTVDFRCVHCGHPARAEVVGIGDGVQSFLNSRGTARRRAQVDARADVHRTLARAKCPKCGRRSGRGVWIFFRPFAIVLAVMIAVGIVAGWAPTWFDMNMAEHDRHICRILLPAICIGTVVLIAPFQMWFRWSGTDARVKWIDES